MVKYIVGKWLKVCICYDFLDLIYEKIDLSVYIGLVSYVKLVFKGCDFLEGKFFMVFIK